MLNGIVSHQDWLPTLLAAAGEPEIKEKLLEGHQAGSKTFRVHIDGFNMLPYLTGEVAESPRETFFYISDDGDILAIRHNDWKVVLMEQRAKQLATWMEPFVPPPDPEDVQPAAGPVRAGRRELEHLLRLDDLACIPDLRHAGDRRRGRSRRSSSSRRAKDSVGRKAFKVDGKALRVRTTMVPRMRTDGTSTASRSGCSGSGTPWRSRAPAARWPRSRRPSSRP